MSAHNLGIFSYEEKLNDDDDDYHSNQADSSENDSDDNDLLEQEEIARTQQLRLQERFLILERTLHSLRNQLREEREMWRREVDEMSNYCNGMCYEASGDVGGRISHDGFRSSSVSLDLESKASYVSDSYVERKVALQRQIAYSNFQRRLLEVENMCNLELLRVKQSAQFLEPLRVMVSEWNSENTHVKDNSKKQEEEGNDEEVDIKKHKDVADAVESIGSKLYNEISEMFNKVTPIAWHTSSEESTLSNNSTSSGTYMSDLSQNSSN